MNLLAETKKLKIGDFLCDKKGGFYRYQIVSFVDDGILVAMEAHNINIVMHEVSYIANSKLENFVKVGGDDDGEDN